LSRAAGLERFAALRASLRRKEGISFFAFPALALQLASSPRDRAGLLPAVPLRGTGICAGRTVWDPTLCKSGKGWGTHGIV